MNVLHELTERDFSDLLYDLGEASIFFSSPLRVTVPDLGWVATVGNGFGGFSRSLFQRGADCTICGNCCKRTFRRVWFWWDTEEPRPLGLEPLRIVLNGKPIWIHLHINELGEYRCDYLVDGNWNGKEVAYCSLHRTNSGNVKPAHCHLHPLTGVYKVRTMRGERSLFSRRLPHRNFRWPKCPIGIAEVPYHTKDLLDDQFALYRMTQALADIPTSRSLDAFTLYSGIGMRTLMGNPPTENIFFEDVFKE